GVAGFLYYPQHEAEKAMSARLTALLEPEKSIPIDSRTKSADCAIHGALPDHACTPGAVFSNATIEKICIPGYSQTVRNVSLTLRKAVFAEYGISYPQLRGAFEVDHLIPLAIGGSNDIANLFPE